MLGGEEHWREEDEAFYQRLRDKERTVLLVKILRDGAAETSERAQGLSALLREDSLGREAFTRAEAGDGKALRTLLFCSTYAGKRPGLLHHLALLHGQAAAARTGDAAVTHTLHALGAWGALLAEGRYLDRLAKEVAPELDESARKTAIRAAVLAPLEDFRVRALSDAAGRGPNAHAGLRLHARRGELSALVGGEAPGLDLELRSLGGEITDAAIEPIERALDDAATAQPGTLQVDLLAKLASLGDWAGGSREVDHRFLERAMPIAWTLYKGSDKSLVARFVATTKECVDRCATRVLMDPSELAQASRVAQMLVFRAESVRTLSEQVTAIEKALEVCPTHRNGRLVGADIFAFRGLERLRGASPLSGSKPVDAAFQDAKRARELWPRCKRLTRLMDELARVGRFLPKEDEETL
ncbi:MAG: hypothetical protein ACI9KE_003810 [Polyangiales bacterium]